MGNILREVKPTIIGKDHMATIYRDGLRIYISASHPDFVEAKAEERSEERRVGKEC